MQIVIDIPEEIYNHTQEYKVGGFNQENDTKLFMAIKNGTPLPKGHGRLIDADEIQFENTEFETYGDYCVAFDAIDDAPAIIEADTEREE